jgi:hypothetical protein
MLIDPASGSGGKNRQKRRVAVLIHDGMAFGGIQFDNMVCSPSSDHELTRFCRQEQLDKANLTAVKVLVNVRLYPNKKISRKAAQGRQNKSNVPKNPKGPGAAAIWMARANLAAPPAIHSFHHRSKANVNHGEVFLSTILVASLTRAGPGLTFSVFLRPSSIKFARFEGLMAEF